MNSFVILTNFRFGSHFFYEIFKNNGYDEVDNEIAYNLLGNVNFDDSKTDQRRIKMIGDLYASNDGFFEYDISQNNDIYNSLLDKFDSYMHSKNKYTAILHRCHSMRILGNNIDLEIDNILRLFDGDNFILLERDLIEATISFYIARNDEKWFSWINDKKGKEFEYNFDEIYKIYKVYQNEWIWPEEKINILNPITVNYNDLYNNTAEVLDCINNKYNTNIKYIKNTKFLKQHNPLKGEFIDKFKSDLKEYKE